jgi:hypothetical protein
VYSAFGGNACSDVGGIHLVLSSPALLARRSRAAGATDPVLGSPADMLELAAGAADLVLELRSSRRSRRAGAGSAVATLTSWRW